MELPDKKTLFIAGIVVLAILGFIFFGLKFGKVDDWKYTYFAIENYFVLGIVVGGIAILAWILFSILLIVRGKPIIGSDGQQRMNPKRIIGILLLAGPISLVLLSYLIFFIAINSHLEILLILIPVLILGFIIWLIIYAVRNRMKVVAIVMLIFLLIIIVGGIIGLSFISGVFGGVGSAMAMSEATAIGNKIGFAVGGAKDISNFRKNIENNYLPLPTDITYEGLFYEYFFETGEKELCQKLFCPSYTYAISKDPFSQEEDYYLLVGLNTGIKASEFQRKI